MNNYYLQIYRYNPDPEKQDHPFLMDDLPFQPVLLESLAAIGIIEPKNRMLSQKDVEKVYKIQRLRNFLGVNLSGAAVIIELLDKLEAMEDELERQKY